VGLEARVRFGKDDGCDARKFKKEIKTIVSLYIIIKPKLL